MFDTPGKCLFIKSSEFSVGVIAFLSRSNSDPEGGTGCMPLGIGGELIWPPAPGTTSGKGAATAAGKGAATAAGKGGLTVSFELATLLRPSTKAFDLPFINPNEAPRPPPTPAPVKALINLLSSVPAK